MVLATEEDSLLAQPHSGEGFVVYAGGCPPRAGRSCRVPLSAKIKANKKEQFTACGKESTYQGTYSGVSFRCSAKVSLIFPSEELKILQSPQSTVHSPTSCARRMGAALWGGHEQGQ